MTAHRSDLKWLLVPRRTLEFITLVAIIGYRPADRNSVHSFFGLIERNDRFRFLFARFPLTITVIIPGDQQFGHPEESLRRLRHINIILPIKIGLFYLTVIFLAPVGVYA